MKLVTVKDHVNGLPTRIISIIILFDEAFSMAMVGNVDVMLGQMLNHSV
jgi:hypothetical protein